MSKPIHVSLIVSALAAACFAPPLSPACAEASASAKSQSFPVKFRGDWYGAPGPCNGDKLALQVGATSLNYFDEFSGRLTRIIRQTDRSIQYVGRYSADGHHWNATETLRLSPKGNEMTLEPERTAPRYFRCTINGAK